MATLDRIGEKHTTNSGEEIEIIEFFSRLNCTVRFNSGEIVKNIFYQNIKQGSVKGKLTPSFCGIGFIGIGSYKPKENSKFTKAYVTWGSVLRRCYSIKYQKTKPTYKDITVCKEWHNFQVFAEWFKGNYKEEFHLDKDILVKSNKVYSPETCCFVPLEINSIILRSSKSRGKCPISVYKSGNRYASHFNKDGILINLGTFDTPEEAFGVYKEVKEKHIKEVAEKWKPKLAPQTYEALINYKIEITD